MRTLLEDARYAARMVRKHPGYAAITILTLAVGIGVNTTTYSVAEVLLFRPLLLPHFDRCVVVQSVVRGTSERDDLSAADWLDLRRDIKSLESVSALRYSLLNLTGTGEPIQLQGFAVTSRFFDALAGHTMLGRAILPSEEDLGKDRVVVLSHALWLAQFGADPHVIGRIIQLGAKQYEVIGVMQREFRFPPVSQYWIPLALSSEERADRQARRFGVIARLKPGVSVTQATAELETIAGRLEKQFPTTNARFSARAELLRENISGELTGRYMRMMLGATLFVLLIACANIANLQFARISLRAREIAVRSALGAGRFRVVRLLLVESVVVALCGGGLGICMALWGMALTRKYMSPEVQRYLPGWDRISLDQNALLFTLALAAAAGIVSGIVPAFLGSASTPGEALKEGGRSSTGGRGRARLRGALVVAEIAVSLTLLVGAGLLIKGVSQVDAPRPGMQPARVLTFRLFLPESRYSGGAGVGDFHRRALDAVSALPGVKSVALVSDLPFSGGSHSTEFTIEGHPPPTASEQPSAQRQCVSANYLAAARIPIVAGRDLTESDGADAPPVAVVSQRLVQRYFGDENPIGKKIRLLAYGVDSPAMTIVGVAADLLHEPFDRLPRATIYRPFLQLPERGAQYLARASAGDPLQLAAVMRRQIASIDRDQPVADVMTWRKVMDDQLLGYRYVVGITTICGSLALGLAAIGVYGILSFAVSERTHEIGVRMALGAGTSEILLLISRWGLQLTATGVILGVVATLGLARLLSGLLFGVGAFDLAAFAAGVAVLCIAALLACWVPVWRAISVNPVVTLRQE